MQRFCRLRDDHLNALAAAAHLRERMDLLGVAAPDKNNTSATPGISWHKANEAWRVLWREGGKTCEKRFLAKNYESADCALIAAQQWQDENMRFDGKKWHR